ncbi:MAG: helix-turn-helix transcriptional regulator [Clostridia bacterium]|nr:helix-turn-helix transcriptional regulator [Clostridia bacterium]
MRAKENSAIDLVKAAEAYMEAHSTERFSLNEMAGALYVNGSYLLRTFRRQTGMTPLHYHHQLRCAKAGEMLAHTEQSISEIGEAVGFVSSSHFSHIFKSTVGCTPSEYRRTHCDTPGEGSSDRTQLFFPSDAD